MEAGSDSFVNRELPLGNEGEETQRIETRPWTKKMKDNNTMRMDREMNGAQEGRKNGLRTYGREEMEG